MQLDYKILGKVVKRLRLKRGVSQEVLSGLANIARTHLSMIENGTKQPNLETLWRIAAALDLPLSALIKMIEDECEASL